MTPRSRSAVSRSATRSAAKPAKGKSAAKPAKPSGKAAAKPAKKPATKKATTRPTAKPAAKSRAKPAAAKRAAPARKPAAKPAARALKPAAKRPASKPAPRPASAALIPQLPVQVVVPSAIVEARPTPALASPPAPSSFAPINRHAPLPPSEAAAAAPASPPPTRDNRPTPQPGQQPQRFDDRRDNRHQDNRPPNQQPPQSRDFRDDRNRGGGQGQPGPRRDDRGDQRHGDRRDNRHPGDRPPQHQQHQQRPPQGQQQPQAPRPPAPQPHVQAQVPAAAPAAHAPATVPAAATGELSPTALAAAKHFEEIFEKNIPFKDLGLNEAVLRGITEAGFVYPTAIQAKLIPLILSGKDMLGQAKTGTGKTAAFGLPLLSRIQRGTPFQALVLVPTRELAIQVATDLRELGRFTNLNILPVYGGQNVQTQAQHLQRNGGPEIIVATPGRVMDMVQRNYIHYRNIKMVVLDEVDRMLDIGFRDDIRRILSTCPRERQTVFVSATISSDIDALARTFAPNAEKIIASAGSLTVSMVKQYHLPVQPWDKKQLLLHLLTHEDPALTVVFCRTKKTVDNLTEYLNRKGMECHAIHGDMYQSKRNKVMEQLRSGKLEVLIASDVASRGLDVEGISHVINYDLPEDPDLYVHRIGRTARAGRDGVAWSLVTPEQGDLLTQIEFLINAEIPKLDYPDFKPGPVPADILARQQHDAKRIETARQFNRFSAPGTLAAAGPVAATPGAAAQAASTGQIEAPAPTHAPASPELNAARFPGGIVPSKAPPKRMFGKVKTSRSMRNATTQPFILPPAAPVEGAPSAPAGS